MQAIRYKVTIYEGVVAFVHGFGSTIEELFLPEIGIAFNHQEVFKPDKDRYKEAKKIGKVEVSNDDVKILKDYLNARKASKIVLSKYFPEKAAKIEKHPIISKARKERKASRPGW